MSIVDRDHESLVGRQRVEDLQQFVEYSEVFAWGTASETLTQFDGYPQWREEGTGEVGQDGIDRLSDAPNRS